MAEDLSFYTLQFASLERLAEEGGLGPDPSNDAIANLLGIMQHDGVSLSDIGRTEEDIQTMRQQSYRQDVLRQLDWCERDPRAVRRNPLQAWGRINTALKVACKTVESMDITERYTAILREPLAAYFREPLPPNFWRWEGYLSALLDAIEREWVYAHSTDDRLAGIERLDEVIAKSYTLQFNPETWRHRYDALFAKACEQSPLHFEPENGEPASAGFFMWYKKSPRRGISLKGLETT